jgi:hypothetical protein
VASQTSGVDGSSEGGRISSVRLPQTLVLYSVPLIDEVKRHGYRGKLTSEPALRDGTWLIKLIYDGDPPQGVPERWHGHRVILEKAPPPPAPPAPPAPAAPPPAPAAKK